jgi:hypothetical protein
MKLSAPGLIIVIPCHDEPGLLTTLDSLVSCHKPDCLVQVRVVINSAQDAAPEILQRNHKTLKAAQSWIAGRQTELLNFILDNHPDLPPKHAGVGLARKIGMDAAAQSYKESGYPGGPIVCLDADCTVAENYLLALVEHFQKHPKTPGCSIHYEHPLEWLSVRHRLGIVAYELYLRYYRQGLRWAGHPGAFHTVGSSMAVRADIYLQQGGMNRRKAGEDFYFLQKIIALGGFTEIVATQVNPSARRSLRVPFGTGRAMDEWLVSGEKTRLTYDPQVFKDLKFFFEQSHNLYEEKFVEPESKALKEYLLQADFAGALSKIRSNTSSRQALQKKFFHWFNLFRVLKFIHYATEFHYPKIPLANATESLWGWMGQPGTDEGRSEESWLYALRQFEKNRILPEE